MHSGDFFAIRVLSKLFRSDRGMNFIGACKEIKFLTSDPNLTSYMDNQGCSWTFNAPHSSHMGGCWEQMIEVARQILEGMLQKIDSNRLTHEVLVTGGRSNGFSQLQTVDFSLYGS